MIPCGLALSYFVRVNGKPALASAGLMLSALINIILDAVFISMLGMGVEGAAYATGIAYTVTTGLLCLHFFTPEARCRFTRTIGAWKEVGLACWNGVSELINEASIGLVILFINWILLARIGSYGVAAFTIINYAAWFGASVSYAISDSLSPLVSANFGARNFARARRFLGLALSMVFGIGLMLYGVFALYPEVLLKIFLPDEEKVVAVTLEFIDWFKLAFLFSGLNMALASFFTALHMAAASAAVALMRSLLFPVGFLWLLPGLFGNAGIYVAIPLAEMCTLVVASLIFAASRKQFTERRAPRSLGRAARDGKNP